MKEELVARLSDLERQYEKNKAEKQACYDRAELINQKMLFLSGAYEELKLLIKKYFSEEPPCVPEEK